MWQGERPPLAYDWVAAPAASAGCLWALVLPSRPASLAHTASQRVRQPCPGYSLLLLVSVGQYASHTYDSVGQARPSSLGALLPTLLCLRRDGSVCAVLPQSRMSQVLCVASAFGWSPLRWADAPLLCGCLLCAPPLVCSQQLHVSTTDGSNFEQALQCCLPDG